MAGRQPGWTLGIDPGSQVTGFGVVEKNGSRLLHLGSGSIRLSTQPSLYLRLEKIHRGLQEIIREYLPTEVAVEKVFMAKNVHSALTLGHARGAALLAAVEAGLELFEYSPLEIKKAVTGYGRADKAQVQSMIKALLSLKTVRSPDVSDALAAAVCHLNWFRALPVSHDRLSDRSSAV
ncbi:MAG: crossover junction endodeoxyribonuclease RuvC [Deltaproteobacteria bacterium]|nr:crossover junction endodeoxyribonuclease RuvC [Deltaproteobacteria bacterium]